MASNAWKPPICRCPVDVFEEIVLELLLSDDPLTLPAGLVNLHLTCKHIHHTLEHSHILARLYRATFDTTAARRRLGPRCSRSRHVQKQLVINHKTLAEIRRGDIYTPDIDHIFWDAFIMLLENDGKNRLWLENAGFGNFVSRFVRERLLEDSEGSGGWPLDNCINSLALWNMSLMLTPETLASHTLQERAEIVRLVLPFVLLACRYPTALLPTNHFHIPLSAELGYAYPHSFETIHGLYPIYRPSEEVINHVNHLGCTIEISHPLITIAAKHIYFAYRELVPIPLPPHLPERRIGFERGVTQEDLIEWNLHKSTKLYCRNQCKRERSTWAASHNTSEPPSAKWDHLWASLTSCYDPWSPTEWTPRGPAYAPGALHGSWAGRMLVPASMHYMPFVTAPHDPAQLSELAVGTAVHPVYMRLQEHHCINPRSSVGTGGLKDGFDDNLFNAYLPFGQMREQNGQLSVTDELGDVRTYYTYFPGKPTPHDVYSCKRCVQRRGENRAGPRLRGMARYATEAVEISQTSSSARYKSVSPRSNMADMNDDDFEFDHSDSNPNTDADMDLDWDTDSDCFDPSSECACDGVEDVVLTGTTDMRYGLAFGFWKFYGRVRLWDGLVAIVRVPMAETPNYMGQLVFTGYLVGGENIIGNWRFCSPDIDVGMPGWEGAFILSRKEEGDI